MSVEQVLEGIRAEPLQHSKPPGGYLKPANSAGKTNTAPPHQDPELFMPQTLTLYPDIHLL